MPGLHSANSVHSVLALRVANYHFAVYWVECFVHCQPLAICRTVLSLEIPGTRARHSLHCEHAHVAVRAARRALRRRASWPQPTVRRNLKTESGFLGAARVRAARAGIPAPLDACVWREYAAKNRLMSCFCLESGLCWTVVCQKCRVLGYSN